MDETGDPAGGKDGKAASIGAADRVRGFRLRHTRETAVLVVLPLILYIASVNFGFVLDDKIVVQENRFVHEGLSGIGKILSTQTLAGFVGEQPNLVAGSRYRPLSLVSFALEYELYGLEPAISHLINVLLYLVTGLILFRFFSIFMPGNLEGPWYLRLPFVAALLFAVHPLHSEVVANIKGRDEILALLFSLAALWMVLRSVQSGRCGFYVLSGAAFLLALLAKENAITFLVVVPLTLLLFAQVKVRTLVVAMIPLAISMLLYLVLRYRAVGYFVSGGGEEFAHLMNNPFLEASIGQKYGTILYTWGLYLKLLFFPHPLTHDYYPYQIPLIGFADPRAIIPLLVYLGMAALAVLGFRKGSIASWAILYYLATFSIVSNLLFPIGTFMNERFMYMPSVGFCLILAWLLTQKLPIWLAAKPRFARPLSLGLTAVFMIGFSFKTFARVPDWKDDLSLNRAGVEVSVGSARINCFMGYSLYELAQEEKDDARVQALLDEAEFYVDRSLEIFPTYRDALNVHAGVLSSRYLIDGRIDVLLDGFFKILTNNKPPHVDEFLTWLNSENRHPKELAEFYRRVGYEYYFQQRKDFAEAAKYLDFGYRVAPKDPAILEALGDFWLASVDDRDSVAGRRAAYKALRYAEEGIGLNPAQRKFHEIAAGAYEKLGDSESAGRVRQRVPGADSP